MFLNHDVERIAGWNEGDKIVIDSAALASVVIQSHEAIHGRIFQETTDGQLHKLCVEAAKSPLDQRHHGLFSRASKILFVQTRSAHEAGATYLAIQGLPTKKLRKEEQKNLTKSYKRHYSDLADIIDPASRTSWLRFAFGWTLIHWAFSSPRARLFFDASHPSLESILHVASPSERLHHAAKVLRKGAKLRNWVTESLALAADRFRLSGRELWDLEDERAWDGHKDDLAVQVFENALTSAAGDWLLNNIGIESEDFRVDKPFGLLFDHIMAELKYVPSRMHTTPDSAANKEWQQWNIERRAIAHSSDSISHQPDCVAVDLTRTESADVAGLFRMGLSTATHCTFISEVRRLEEVSVLLREASEGFGAEPSVYRDVGSYKVTPQTASHLLRRVFPSHGSPNLHTWMLIKTGREEILTAATLALSVAGGRNGADLFPPTLVPERILFYIGSPWHELYQLPGTKFTSFRLALLDEQGAEVKPLSLRIAKPPTEFPGYLISAKPDLSGFRLDEYEKLLTTRGTIDKLVLAEAELRKVATPFLDAWHVWSSI